MTPREQQAPQSYPLPIIALVLSVLGVCLCVTAPIGFILGLVALLRISKEPHLPGKGLAIAAMVVPFGLIPVIGIQAAIAIPNFIKFQARSKQSECKVNLKALYNTAQVVQMDTGKWPTTLKELPWAPERGNRYSYYLSPTEVLPGSTGDAKALDKVDFAPPFTAACVGNIDNDETMDVWTVADDGLPNNLSNDVSE
jgi:type IV pilus assembly protein PilA